MMNWKIALCLLIVSLFFTSACGTPMGSIPDLGSSVCVFDNTSSAFDDCLFAP